jgi:glycosyltransferase involved in cell wall biosynthesis
MRQGPTVSVIMNCLNCERFVGEAIDSVFAQTFPGWEIVFYDNASSDGSGRIARGYDVRLRYFRRESTVPLGEARNEAIAQAKGELIAFLDCDDVWMPTKLEKQVPLFDDERVGLAYCDTIFFNSLGHEWQLYKHRPHYEGHCFRRLITDYFLSMETVVIRKDALERLDYWFDERFNMIEEADLFRRIAHGWELKMVDEPLARWRVHEASWTSKHPELLSRETEMMLAKYRELYLGFDADFGKEVGALRASVAINEAKLAWLGGDSVRARRMLRPYFRHPKATVLFGLTFAPRRFGRALLTVLRSDVLPT